MQDGVKHEMSDVEDCRFYWCCRNNYPVGVEEGELI